MTAAAWVTADAWIRAVEGDDPPGRRLALVPEVEADPFPELLARLDQVAAEHRRSRLDRIGGHYSGRRAALLADRELAEAFHALCLAEGVGTVRAGLELSRQSLQDVWAAHGLRPPGRVAPRRGPKWANP
jgi:hypothetical protein